MPLVPRYLNPKKLNAKAYGRKSVKFVSNDEAHADSSLQPVVPFIHGVSKSFHFCVKTAALIFIFSALSAMADGVRIRDLAMISGARDNQLVGYGLVVGLAGDGDKDQIYTKQSIGNMLQRYGI